METVQPARQTLEVRAVRCGCGDPDAHNGVRGPAGLCPKPRPFNAETDLRIVESVTTRETGE